MRKYAWLYILVTILLVIWLGQYFLNQPVQTQLVQSDTYEEKVSVSGVMLRNETVYTSSKGGTLESAVRDGERVAKGKKIATVYQDGIDTQIKQNLDAVNQKIERLQNSLSKGDIFTSDLATIETQIKSGISELIDIANSGDYSNLLGVKEELERMVGKQQEVSGEGEESPKQSALDALLAEKAEYESQINSAKQDIISQASGIYIPVVDGLESILLPSNIESLTVHDFKSLQVPEEIPEKKETVGPGEAVCKTVENSLYMSAALIGEKDIYGMEAGDSVQLRYTDLSSEAIDGTIEYISPIEDGQAVIVVSANQYLDSIYTVRKVDFDIIKKTYSGLSIPADALRIEDDTTGVYVDSEGVARFREVNVLYKNDEIAIVEDTTSQTGKLKLYDSVIVRGKDLEDGKIIN